MSGVEPRRRPSSVTVAPPSCRIRARNVDSDATSRKRRSVGSTVARPAASVSADEDFSTVSGTMRISAYICLRMRAVSITTACHACRSRKSAPRFDIHHGRPQSRAERFGIEEDRLREAPPQRLRGGRFADPERAVQPDDHRHMMWQAWHMCETDSFARPVNAEPHAMLAALATKAAFRVVARPVRCAKAPKGAAGD
jgi:hypothetical protein